MARPTKLTPEVSQRICDILRAGNTRKAAAEFAGVTYRTLLNWAEEGAKSEEEADPYFQFFHALTRAESECEVRNVATIEKAAAGYDTQTIKRTSRTVIKTRKVTHPDGTVVEEPVPVTVTSEEITTGREFDWRPASWWLERRRPDDYKLRAETAITGPNGGPVQITNIEAVKPQNVSTSDSGGGISQPDGDNPGRDAPT